METAKTKRCVLWRQEQGEQHDRRIESEEHRHGHFPARRRHAVIDQPGKPGAKPTGRSLQPKVPISAGSLAVHSARAADASQRCKASELSKWMSTTHCDCRGSAGRIYLRRL